MCSFQWFIGQSSAAGTKATQTRLRFPYDEVVATKILRSSSQSGWPLRYIHISNDNRSFTFHVNVFFHLSLPKLLPDLTVYIRLVSYKKQKLLILREHLSSPLFLAGSVLLIFLDFSMLSCCSCLIYVICVNTHCVVCLLCLPSSCWQFLLIVHFWLPLRYSLTFIGTLIVIVSYDGWKTFWIIFCNVFCIMREIRWKINSQGCKK